MARGVIVTGRPGRGYTAAGAGRSDHGKGTTPPRSAAAPVRRRISASRHQAVTGLGHPPPPPYGPRMPRWLHRFGRTPRPREFPPDRRLDRQRQERGGTGRSGPPRRTGGTTPSSCSTGTARWPSGPPATGPPGATRRRIVYEPLTPPTASSAGTCCRGPPPPTPSRRLIEDAETRDEVAQCFMAQRNLDTAQRQALDQGVAGGRDRPLPVAAAAEPLGSLLAAFRVGSAEYERLLGDCRPAMTSSPSSATWSGCGGRTRCSTRSRPARAAGCWNSSAARRSSGCGPGPAPSTGWTPCGSGSSSPSTAAASARGRSSGRCSCSPPCRSSTPSAGTSPRRSSRCRSCSSWRRPGRWAS